MSHMSYLGLECNGYYDMLIVQYMAIMLSYLITQIEVRYMLQFNLNM